MKKRLRKKLHRREFRRWCFSVRGTPPGNMLDPDWETKMDAFVQDLLQWADDRGLMVGGLVGGVMLDFIVDACSDHRCVCGQARPFGVVEADRDDVRAWLEAHGCTLVEVSALWDTYQGRDPFGVGWTAHLESCGVCRAAIDDSGKVRIGTGHPCYIGELLSRALPRVGEAPPCT